MIDVEALLNPISDDAPAGPNLRLVVASETLDQAKKLAEELSPQLDPDGKGKEANWPAVIERCESALREEAKDLELNQLLLEALVRVHGYTGLRAGFELFRRLLESFWDSVHPGVSDEGEISLPARARWLNALGTDGFLAVVRAAALNYVDPSVGRGEPNRTAEIGWLDYGRSRDLEDQTLSEERRSELVELGYRTREQCDALVAAVDPSALATVKELVGAALGEIEGIEKLAQERFGADDEEVPSLYAVREVLDEVKDFLEARTAGSGVEEETEGAAEGNTVQRQGGGSGPIATRQDALARLREVGDYFRRVEPHSPMAHLIGRAVRWGNMPFEELLRDLARNDDVIGHIWETLGLDKGGDESSE